MEKMKGEAKVLLGKIEGKHEKVEEGHRMMAGEAAGGKGGQCARGGVLLGREGGRERDTQSSARTSLSSIPISGPLPRSRSAFPPNRRSPAELIGCLQPISSSPLSSMTLMSTYPLTTIVSCSL